MIAIYNSKFISQRILRCEERQIFSCLFCFYCSTVTDGFEWQLDSNFTALLLPFKHCNIKFRRVPLGRKNNWSNSFSTTFDRSRDHCKLVEWIIGRIRPIISNVQTGRIATSANWSNIFDLIRCNYIEIRSKMSLIFDLSSM